MRYEIIGVQRKSEKLRITCRDCSEKAILRVSLDPNTLECLDPFIPEELQHYIAINKKVIGTKCGA